MIAGGNYKQIERNKEIATRTQARKLGGMNSDDRKFMKFMCAKGCKFFDKEKQTCIKKRYIRDCSRKGLKNRE